MAKLVLFQRMQRLKAQLFIAHSGAACERNDRYFVPSGKPDKFGFTSSRDSGCWDPLVLVPEALPAFVRATPPAAAARQVHAPAAEYRAADFPADFPAAARLAVQA
jgi:hypothetical protein